MKDKKNSTSFWKTPLGNIIGALIYAVIVQGLLNYDFWNFGPQTLYFGWLPGAYLYRAILFFVIVPISLVILMRVCWPNDPEDEA